MSFPKKATLLAIWLIVSTPLYLVTWSHNLDYFPQLPQWVGVEIAKITGLYNTEDTETLTAYYMLIVSFFSVCCITLAAFLLWRLFRKIRSTQ